MAEAGDPGAVPERLVERLAERQTRVLDGVVGVDVDVAVGLHGQVEQGVLGEAGEHVVVEADAGGDRGPAGAVEVELHEHGGLVGRSLDAGGAAHRASPDGWRVDGV